MQLATTGVDRLNVVFRLGKMLRTAHLLSNLLLISCITRWEMRTLKCEDTFCHLAVGNGTFQEADCTLSGADRDSVISKSPTTNRMCIRFYTYNTQKTNNGWQLWRNGKCTDENITLQVHCGFLYEE
ncbi:hypothetical protein DICVIV_10861 [Dictyocaulus viviparus]|uniref:DUF7808 domain-containing protein n=1 Tax=Dictyocaulus viviparus TaxID=29172 RepID=A0A0D8XEQ8_DICVI|nr:hypothetical protein DICVIV_10861 [Dictyocaulus viviparus]